MNPAPKTTGLQVPGQSSNSTAKHQLRQRSPQGKRGRSRKSSASASPRQPHTAARRVQDSRWFYPGLAAFGLLVLALIYSAIRISSHTADFYPPHTNLAPRPLVKKSRVGRAGAPDAPSAPDSRRPAASQGVKKVKVGEQELDEAIRSALEDTWHLSAAGRADPVGETGGKSDGIDEASIEKGPSGRPQDVAERNTQSRRSLAELYEELDQMGISVDELNEVMQNAIGGNL